MGDPSRVKKTHNPALILPSNIFGESVSVVPCQSCSGQNPNTMAGLSAGSHSNSDSYTSFLLTVSLFSWKPSRTGSISIHKVINFLSDQQNLTLGPRRDLASKTAPH